MLNAEKGQAQNLDGAQLRVGIVQARFNESITNSLTQACREELLALGVQAGNIDHVTVPGALEVPVALQEMAESDRYDALVALGCIIRGETYHFELVANESGAGVTGSKPKPCVPRRSVVISPSTRPMAISSVASTAAVIVLPVPGGPTNKSLRRAVNPCSLRRSC